MPLASFILRRLLQLIPTLIFILIVVFVLVRLLPGDPTSAILGDRALDADVERINRELGLDRSLPVQFWAFVKSLATGNLGNSISLKVPVTDLIVQRLPITILLTVMAALIALVMAVPLAFLAALQRGRHTDAVIRGAFQVGLSMPVFYIGLLLLTVFGAKLGWFPVGGYGDGFWEHLHHLFLPAFTLALSLAAIVMRNLRAAIIGVVDADYVQFARAKGLATRLVMLRHVLRNALIPMVTYFGIQLAGLLTGAVVTEQVFSRPGLGRVAITAIGNRDFPLIQGTVLVTAVVYVLVSLVVDLSYAVIDPRIRYE